jgi:hypothetical protein
MREKPFHEMLPIPRYTWFDWLGELAADKQVRASHQFETNCKLPGVGMVKYTWGDLVAAKIAAKTCAVCEKPFDSSHLGTDKKGDHDHETGILRGILCQTCNITLGYYEKFQKNPDLVARFKKYLGGK